MHLISLGSKMTPETISGIKGTTLHSSNPHKKVPLTFACKSSWHDWQYWYIFPLVYSIFHVKEENGGSLLICWCGRCNLAVCAWCNVCLMCCLGWLYESWGTNKYYGQYPMRLVLWILSNLENRRPGTIYIAEFTVACVKIGPPVFLE